MPLPTENLFFGLTKKMSGEQRDLVDSILDYHVVFSNSPSGSGKTTMSIASLYYLHQKGAIDKVYYIFSPVEEKRMGFRPGSQPEKESEYLTPLFDALGEIGQMPERALDPKSGWIEAQSHIFMRGMNLKKSGVLIDEAQNWTHSQLQKAITRVDDLCHLVVVGHEGQIDLESKRESGFSDFITHFKVNEPDKVKVCNLTRNYRGWISQTADSIKLHSR